MMVSRVMIGMALLRSTWRNNTVRPRGLRPRRAHMVLRILQHNRSEIPNVVPTDKSTQMNTGKATNVTAPSP